MRLIMNLLCGLWLSLLVGLFEGAGAVVPVHVEFLFVFLGIILGNRWHIVKIMEAPDDK